MTNFLLYLIQLWWQFFQIVVYGDVVYAQTWEILTLKNCIEPPQEIQIAYCIKRLKEFLTIVTNVSENISIVSKNKHIIICKQQILSVVFFYNSI